MAVTLNCGIGMVIVCAPVMAETIMENLTNQGETAMQIGYIDEAEDKNRVIINNTDTAWK